MATARTALGVICVTLCGHCCGCPLPGLPLLAALTRVGEHCAHLGVDLDVMAEVLDGDDE